MRITVDRRADGFHVEVDRPPMQKARFRALCALAAWAVYSCMVVGVAALCGLVGVIVVGLVTLLIGAGVAVAS